jgi:hypothetical protein
MLTIIRNEANLKTYALTLEAGSSRFAQVEAAFDALEAKHKGFFRVAEIGAQDAATVELLIRNY